MTKQETFDIVAKHLLTQGCRAVVFRGSLDWQGFESSSWECNYRVPDTSLKCAAGVLIPDELYDKKFEGLAITSPSSRKLTPVGRLISRLGHDVDLVGRLQTIHDVKEVSQWPSELLSLAQKEGLNTEVLA